MSAWVVSKTHIDLLVTAGLVLPGRAVVNSNLNWYSQGPNPHHLGTLDHTNADEVGVMLWAENYRSVDKRYPGADDKGDLPGPEGFTGATTLTYQHTMIPGVIDPVVVLKAIGCYEYQSCEHDEWPTSPAFAYCRALEKHAIQLLPGYDAAPWGFDDPAYFTSRATIA